jgi:predicted metal-dependent phosphoesterase TrpH
MLTKINLRGGPACRIDLHVHTRRHSPCAESLSPEGLGPYMRSRDLGGVVLTEHNILWARDELARLAETMPDQKVYRGVELACREGHFLLIGLDDLDGLRPNRPVAESIAAAHRQGAVVILAHPHLQYPGVNVQDSPVYPPGIDAVEILSTMTRGPFGESARRLGQTHGWHPVAGSDAHCLDHVGFAFTVFDHLPADEKELAHLIGGGLGRPGLAEEPDAPCSST